MSCGYYNHKLFGWRGKGRRGGGGYIPFTCLILISPNPIWLAPVSSNGYSTEMFGRSLLLPKSGGKIGVLVHCDLNFLTEWHQLSSRTYFH